MPKRIAFLVYGVLCYASFVAVLVYAIGFLANVGVPKSIDTAQTGSAASAIMINALLLLVFALQHTVMARPTFKRWWTRIVPKPVERSTYVLLTNAALALLFWQWHTIDTPLWHFTGGLAVVLWALFATGIALVFVSTVLLNHFDLFGLRQVWLYFRGRKYNHLPFKTPALYKYIRHPLYVGWFMTFWCTPHMTVGHLLFATLSTLYILVAIWFEERNLVESLGKAYAQYKQRVPRFIPRLQPARVPENAKTARAV